MNDVLDTERIQRFRRVRDDLLKTRDALQLKLNQMRIERVQAEQDLRELDHQIGIATRHLRKAEKPLSEYISEVVCEEDAGRGYYAMILAEANRRKSADILRSTGAVNAPLAQRNLKSIGHHQS